jgi:hypothetical protein
VCVAGGRDGRGGTGRAGRKYTKMWGTRANRRFDGQIDGKSEMRYSDVNCAVNGRFLKQTWTWTYNSFNLRLRVIPTASKHIGSLGLHHQSCNKDFTFLNVPSVSCNGLTEGKKHWPRLTWNIQSLNQNSLSSVKKQDDPKSIFFNARNWTNLRTSATSLSVRRLQLLAPLLVDRRGSLAGWSQVWGPVAYSSFGSANQYKR